MNTALPDTIDKKVMIKVEDNITTDHIGAGRRQGAALPLQHREDLYVCLHEQ